MNAAARSRIAHASLAPAGEQRIRWVSRHSPVLNRLARERLADGALRGRRVAVVVHLEAKTAYLALLLAEAGAEVVRSSPAGSRCTRRTAPRPTSSTPTCSPSPRPGRRSSSTTAVS